MNIGTIGSRNMDATFQKVDTIIQNATGTSGSAETSGPQAMMKELGQLDKTDPAKFKAATANIAKQLDTLAGQQTGDAARLIKDLASKFDQASKTGNLDALKPPDDGPPKGGQRAISSAQLTSIQSGLDDALFEAMKGSSDAHS